LEFAATSGDLAASFVTLSRLEDRGVFDVQWAAERPKWREKYYDHFDRRKEHWARSYCVVYDHGRTSSQSAEALVQMFKRELAKCGNTLEQHSPAFDSVFESALERRAGKLNARVPVRVGKLAETDVEVSLLHAYACA